jgi:hypothetical protein
VSAKPAWQQKLGLGELRAVASVGDAWWAAGNLISWQVLGKDPEQVVLGAPAVGWYQGHGVVWRLQDDGTLVQRIVFAGGLFKPTAIVADDAGGAYVGGYAAESMVALLADRPGLQRVADWSQRSLRTWCAPEHSSEPLRREINDQRGVPCVLRLDAHGALIAGTFLEGWESTWHVPEPLSEDASQPVLLVRMPDGDLVVAHDGGYNLPPPASGLEAFYAVPDHLSRLSPDLTQRRWHVAWHSPAIADPSAVERHQRSAFWFGMDGGTPTATWKHPLLGNPRTLGLTVDGAGRLVCVGWSPTRTAAEPWWSPFVIRFDGSGQELSRWYSPDPFAGEGERLGGLVSDAAVFAVAAHGPTDLVLSLAGDGGNNVLLSRDPRDWTQPSGLRWQGSRGMLSGRHLFWGGLGRLDGEGALVAAAHLGKPYPAVKGKHKGQPMSQECFATALTTVGDGRIVAIGRYRGEMPRIGQAWETPPPQGAYGGFLAVFGADLTTRFCTATDPFTATAMAAREGRIVLAGVVGRQVSLMAIDL